MGFANIFSQFLAFLFIPSTRSSIEQKFLLFMKSNLLIFYGFAFGVKSKNSLPTSRSQRCPCVFFLKVLYFALYIEVCGLLQVNFL